MKTTSLALIVIALFAVALTAGGLHQSYDSERYLETAATFRDAGTIRTDYGSWTPLYPLLLSLSSDVLTWARWLNVACYALTVWLALKLVPGRQDRVQLALTIALILSPALTLVHQLVWSEPLFVTLSLAVLALTPTAARRWLLLALVVALACVQRYTGILLIPIGLLALVLDRAAWYKIGAFLLIAGLPLGLWVLRNLNLGYGALGARSDAQFTFYQSAQFGTLTLAGWLLTFGIALWFARGFPARIHPRVLLMCTLYSTLHFGLTIYSGATTGIDAPDNRLLAPVFVPLLICTFAAARYLATWKHGSRRVARPVSVAAGD